MKTRFSTIDIMAVLHDLQQFIGMRVNNVYDIDSKTYLIRLMKPDAKCVLLFESGFRIHSTEFDWPKSMAPSSFSMKLRKHIKQKRLEYIGQVGADRIVEMKFGSGEVACHVFVELYDRGNIVLTDHTLTILNVLRPRTDKDTDVKFVVKETYPIHLCRQWQDQQFTGEALQEIFVSAKVGDNLRKILNPKFQYGPALLDHCLMEAGFRRDCQFGKQFNIPDDLDKLCHALTKAEEIFGQIRHSSSQGYITYKLEKRMADGQDVESYEEFHPFLFVQQNNQVKNHKEFPTFNAAVDDFFSKLETQKLDQKALQQEKVALKKCDNIRKDHEQRLKELKTAQDSDYSKAELILTNSAMVDRAVLVIRSALANQLSWEEIKELVEEAQEQGDPTALAIKKLKLETSQITLALPTSSNFNEVDSDDGEPGNSSVLVDIDLNLNAHQNARKYFDHKKQAAIKEKKTLEASKKALKTAESKMHETLKQVQVKTAIMKSRKTYWFEKFLWFFSSDDLLVVGGRDAQQNELLVKRYLRPGDIYVHADIRGAASVIIKNPISAGSDEQSIPPPRTLQEAGTMAVCYSAAWDAKVVTSAWWVKHDQVSKTAPAGEYLTTGSFMIRGKKNFLPPCQLVMGFGVLFRLDEESIPRHQEMKRQQRLNRLESVETPSEEPAGEEDMELQVESGESDDDQKGNEKTEDSADKEIGVSGAAKLVDVSEEVMAKNEKEIATEEQGENGEMEFPDVKVRLRHLTTGEEEDEETSVIQIGPRRNTQQCTSSQRMNLELKKKISTDQPKRGQRQKQKKIKEKYKDQDEEERQLRMQLLGSAGGGEKEKKGGKKQKTLPLQGKQKKGNQQGKPKPAPIDGKENIFTNTQPEVSGISQPAQVPRVENVDSRNDEEPGDQEEHSQWNVEITGAQEALTNAPLEDDVLLFGISMCAPYSAFSSFKYKVKLTPGTAKKGKATKTALTVFMKDRTCTGRERELMKAMQDQDLARNLPGKVKLSAPQLTMLKKQR